MLNSCEGQRFGEEVQNGAAAAGKGYAEGETG